MRRVIVTAVVLSACGGCVSGPMADNPTLARSIRNRYPYLDPLHVMQIDLLRRHRAGERSELVERGIQLTINAIATGLRNSG